MSSYYTNLKPGYSDIIKRSTTPTTIPTQQTTPPIGQAIPQINNPAAQANTSFQNYASRIPTTQPATQQVPSAMPVPVIQKQPKTTMSLPELSPEIKTVTNPVMRGPTVNTSSASRAAQLQGQQQEQAQAKAMATASAAPAAAAGILPPKGEDFTTLKDQGALTEAGNLYSDYVTSVLRGDRAIAGVDSARTDAERRNALNYSNTLRQAQEAAAQSGLQPGTAGYQRIINEAMSGIASQNLDRTNSVNQLQRQGYQDILGLGKGLEDTSRVNAIGERNYQTGRADTAYTRGIEDRNFQTERADVAYNRSETGRLEKQTQEMAAINSIEDPKARQAALNQYLQSQQGNYGSVLGLFNPDGSLKPEYASVNPAQASYEQRVAELKAYYPTKTDAEIQAMAQSEREQERAITRDPIDKATSEAEMAKIKEKIKLNRPVDPADIEKLQASDKIPYMNSRVGPQGVDGVNKFLKENPDGLINLDGTVYKVVAALPNISGVNGTKGIPTKMTDMNGDTVYLVDGKIIKPNAVS